MGLCSGISILLVDHEAGFRSAFASMLREDGHRVIECPDLVELAGPRPLAAVDVLVCAHDMPMENGLWLADRLHASRPLLPAILLAAYCPPSLDDELASRSFLRLVEKPVAYDTVHVLIHELATRAPGPARGATVH